MNIREKNLQWNFRSCSCSSSDDTFKFAKNQKE